MIYNYEKMEEEKNKWLSGEPVGDHTGEPNPNHYFEMKFNAEKAGINIVTINIATSDVNTMKGKKLYLVYDPQSAAISPDYDKAWKFRVDSEGVLLAGHEEPAPAVEQKVEENKRPVVIIRKKSSVPKALPKKLVGLKKPVDVRKDPTNLKDLKNVNHATNKFNIY